MNTDYWASLDQYTSFAKEPWGFDRPENRKEHSFLSRATFAEWPNTTCDFSIERGLAPSGKLSVSKARVVDRRGNETASSSSSSSPTPTSKMRTLCTTNNERARTNIKGRPTSTDAIGAAAAAVTFGGTRNSADNVTAAYPLTSTRRVPSGHHNARTPSPQQIEIKPQRALGGRKAASPWSVNNIGFNNPEGEIRAHRKREDDEGYVRAAFASQAADKPYIAEALHFRSRYPHTLGHIAALSNARGDRHRATIKDCLER